MLATEIRSLGLFVAIVAAMLASVVLALVIGQAGHFSVYVDTAIAAVFLGVFAFASSVLWLRYHLRYRQRSGRWISPEEPARYAPVVINVIVVLVNVFAIAIEVRALNASGWRHGVDTFVLSCMCCAWFLYSATRAYRSRSTQQPAPVHPFAQKRLEQLTAAYALPAGPQRSAALRPLRIRGFVRLGLLVALVPLMLLLAPHTGISGALTISVGIVVLLFLVLHRFFEL